MREKPNLTREVIVFNGMKFRRYPDSKRWNDRNYFTPNASNKKKGIGYLHQEIWKAANGPIPSGCQIHHIDHNPLNNDLSNLSCLTVQEHAQHHFDTLSDGQRAKRKWAISHGKAKEAANNWHGSPEGREWHKELGRLAWKDKPYQKRICQTCGKEYETRNINGREKYCSARCKQTERRRQGKDRETRVCKCGKSFSTIRFTKQKYCSAECGIKYGKKHGPSKGITLSDEHRRHIGEALKGRTFSPETIERMRESAKVSQAKRKRDAEGHYLAGSEL